MTTQLMTIARTWLRTFVADGVPSSGINKPSKSQGLQTIATIDDAIDALYKIQAIGGMVIYSSAAAMNADNSKPNGTWAIIFTTNPADDLDIYQYSTAGGGVWVYKSTLSMHDFQALLQQEIDDRTAADVAIDARLDALELTAIGDGNFVPASDAEMIAGTNTTKGATPYGTGVAIEGYAFDTYTGGAPYSMKDRFKREIPLEDTSLVFGSNLTTPTADQANAFKAYLLEAALGRKAVTMRDGTKSLWIGEIICSSATDSVEGPIHWRFQRGFTIKGIAGPTGSIILLHNKDYLTGGARYDATFEYVTIDNSLRSTAVAVASGTCLTIRGFNHVFTLRYTAVSTDTTRTHGDSGMSQNDCSSSTHIDYCAIRQPDLGLYVIGDPPGSTSVPPDSHVGDPDYVTRVGHTMINPRMIQCTAGVSFKNLSQFAAVYGGMMYRCGIGVLGDHIGTGAVGETPIKYNSPQLIVQGLRGKFLQSRLVHAGPACGAIVQGCLLEDWGCNPNLDANISNPGAAVASGSVRAAYHLNGLKRSIWSGNRAEMKHWINAAEGTQGFLLARDEEVADECTNNLIDGNMMQNCEFGIWEEDGSEYNHGTNVFDGVTASYTKASTATGEPSYFGVRSGGTLKINYFAGSDVKTNTASTTVSGAGYYRQRLTGTIAGAAVLTLPKQSTPLPLAKGKMHRIENVGIGAGEWTVMGTFTVWSAATNYAVNDYIKTSANRYYRCTTDGPSTSTIQPTHTSGTVIGADGYGWTFTATSFMEFGSLAQDEWMDVVWNGTSWELSARGSLLQSTLAAQDWIAEADTFTNTAGFSLPSTAKYRVRLTGSIGSTQTLTLPTSGLTPFKLHRIERTGGGTGEWQIGGLGQVSAGEWLDIVWNGSAWEKSAGGSMSAP